MTESEAIKELHDNIDLPFGVTVSDEASRMSINALEEIERYRNIGVVSSYEMEQDLLLYKADREILNGYQELGTVEELRHAKEKQIPKKPILKHDVSVMHINRGNQPHEWKRLESDNWHCPECDSFVGERVYVRDRHHDQRKKKYCDNCGQKLNWESDEE